MKISEEDYKNVQELKRIALAMNNSFRHKILSIGMIGEIECCRLMNWDMAETLNNVGHDAIDEHQNKIQIKTFVIENKTSMLPAFNPEADKNKNVNKLVIVELTQLLEVKRILQVNVEDYHSKLLSVEQQRTDKSKNKNRTKRYDLRISEFEGIKNLETLYPISR